MKQYCDEISSTTSWIDFAPRSDDGEFMDAVRRNQREAIRQIISRTCGRPCGIFLNEQEVESIADMVDLPVLTTRWRLAEMGLIPQEEKIRNARLRKPGKLMKNTLSMKDRVKICVDCNREMYIKAAGRCGSCANQYYDRNRVYKRK